MSIPTDRYIQYAPKDFFYVMVHDPTPPSLDGGTPFTPDGGLQPPPNWMPGIWSSHLDSVHGSVEIVDIEPGRATWRVRAGAKDAPAAAPLRELTGADAGRALLAVGLGAASDKRALGLVTSGRMAVAIRGGAGSGAIVVGEDGRLGIVRADDAPILGDKDDLVEMPLLLWDGQPVATASGAAVPRAAIGITASGQVILARGSFASAAPLGEALSRAGCTRALSLDRGTLATALFDRSGTASPPRMRYEQSVLYAIAAPLHPRGFRFEAAAPLVAQRAEPRPKSQ
jgi:hypothetical protein